MLNIPISILLLPKSEISLIKTDVFCALNVFICLLYVFYISD